MEPEGTSIIAGVSTKAAQRDEFQKDGATCMTQARENTTHGEAACGPVEIKRRMPASKLTARREGNHSRAYRGGGVQGQNVKVKFYEAGSGTERVLDHDDREPIDDLIDRYCASAKTSRESKKFEV